MVAIRTYRIITFEPRAGLLADGRLVLCIYTPKLFWKSTNWRPLNNFSLLAEIFNIYPFFKRFTVSFEMLGLEFRVTKVFLEINLILPMVHHKKEVRRFHLRYHTWVFHKIADDEVLFCCQKGVVVVYISITGYIIFLDKISVASTPY